MTEHWWAWPSATERIYAGFHPSDWGFGARCSLSLQQFTILIGPITIGVSWWSYPA